MNELRKISSPGGLVLEGCCDHFVGTILSSSSLGVQKGWCDDHAVLLPDFV